jgi:hypothetical protein
MGDRDARNTHTSGVGFDASAIEARRAQAGALLYTGHDLGLHRHTVIVRSERLHVLE